MEQIQNISRHDIPQYVINLLQETLDTNLFDLKEIVYLIVTHKTDWLLMTDDIVKVSYNLRQIDGGKVHSKIITLAEEIWKEEM